MRVSIAPCLSLHGCQSLQDAARTYVLLDLAGLTQFAELVLELGQLGNPHVDVGNVFVQQFVDGPAIAGWLVHQAQ